MTAFTNRRVFLKGLGAVVSAGMSMTVLAQSESEILRRENLARASRELSIIPVNNVKDILNRLSPIIGLPSEIVYSAVEALYCFEFYKELPKTSDNAKNQLEILFTLRNFNTILKSNDPKSEKITTMSEIAQALVIETKKYPDTYNKIAYGLSQQNGAKEVISNLNLASAKLKNLQIHPKSNG